MLKMSDEKRKMNSPSGAATAGANASGGQSTGQNTGRVSFGKLDGRFKSAAEDFEDEESGEGGVMPGVVPGKRGWALEEGEQAEVFGDLADGDDSEGEVPADAFEDCTNSGVQEALMRIKEEMVGKGGWADVAKRGWQGTSAEPGDYREFIEWAQTEYPGSTRDFDESDYADFQVWKHARGGVVRAKAAVSAGAVRRPSRMSVDFSEPEVIEALKAEAERVKKASESGGKAPMKLAEVQAKAEKRKLSAEAMAGTDAGVSGQQGLCGGAPELSQGSGAEGDVDTGEDGMPAAETDPQVLESNLTALLNAVRFSAQAKAKNKKGTGVRSVESTFVVGAPAPSFQNTPATLAFDELRVLNSARHMGYLDASASAAALGPSKPLEAVAPGTVDAVMEQVKTGAEPTGGVDAERIRLTTVAGDLQVSNAARLATLRSELALDSDEIAGDELPARLGANDVRAYALDVTSDFSVLNLPAATDHRVRFLITNVRQLRKAPFGMITILISDVLTAVSGVFNVVCKNCTVLAMMIAVGKHITSAGVDGGLGHRPESLHFDVPDATMQALVADFARMVLGGAAGTVSQRAAATYLQIKSVQVAVRPLEELLRELPATKMRAALRELQPGIATSMLTEGRLIIGGGLHIVLEVALVERAPGPAGERRGFYGFLVVGSTSLSIPPANGPRLSRIQSIIVDSVPLMVTSAGEELSEILCGIYLHRYVLTLRGVIAQKGSVFSEEEVIVLPYAQLCSMLDQEGEAGRAPVFALPMNHNNQLIKIIGDRTPATAPSERYGLAFPEGPEVRMEEADRQFPGVLVVREPGISFAGLAVLKEEDMLSKVLVRLVVAQRAARDFAAAADKLRSELKVKEAHKDSLGEELVESLKDLKYIPLEVGAVDLWLGQEIVTDAVGTMWAWPESPNDEVEEDLWSRVGSMAMALIGVPVFVVERVGEESLRRYAVTASPGQKSHLIMKIAERQLKQKINLTQDYQAGPVGNIALSDGAKTITVLALQSVTGVFQVLQTACFGLVGFTRQNVMINKGTATIRVASPEAKELGALWERREREHIAQTQSKAVAVAPLAAGENSELSQDLLAFFARIGQDQDS